MDSDSKSKKAITIISPGGCHQCHWGIEHPYMVSVSSIEAGDESWIAHGEGRLKHVTAHCPMCAQMYRAVVKKIPIHCEPFSCPKCGENEHLEYNVQKIEAEKSSFEFIAEIKCSKCSNKKTFKKLIKQIMEVLKIEIGPSGVTVKNA